MAKSSWPVIISLFVCLTLPKLLPGQATVTSTILGTVVDPQGAAIVGAQVRLLNLGTGRALETASGQDGHYVFPDLNAGSYQVEVRQAGFKPTQSQPVTLGASGTTQRIDVALAMA